MIDNTLGFEKDRVWVNFWLLMLGMSLRAKFSIFNIGHEFKGKIVVLNIGHDFRQKISLLIVGMISGEKFCH